MRKCRSGRQRECERECVCVCEREVMATAQGKYAPIIRAILKSALGAIPLSCSPSLLLLLPCFPISHHSHALLHNLLFFHPPLILQSVHFHFSCYNARYQNCPAGFWYFAPCGRSVSPPQFRGPAGSAQHFYFFFKSPTIYSTLWWQTIETKSQTFQQIQ